MSEKETFSIEVEEDRILLRGRFDAAQAEKAKEATAGVEGSAEVDFSELSYIASAGIGVLFALHSRLKANGGGLRFVKLKPMIWEVFKIANFDQFIDIEKPQAES